MQAANTNQYFEAATPDEPARDDGERHRGTKELLSWLRSPWCGYLGSLLLVGIVALLDKIDQYFPGAQLFVGAPFALVSMLVGLIWGIGPALFSIALGLIAIAEFISPGVFNLNIGRDVIISGPFVGAQLIAMIAVMRFESSRRHLLAAQQEIRTYTQELEQANQALVQANSLKNHFITRASHELRTPLTTIQGQAQFALRRLNKSQETGIDLALLQKHFENIEKKTHHMKMLIEDLIDLSGLRSERIPLHLTIYDFKNVCHEAIEDQREFAGRSFELQFPSNPMIIQADYGRLLQVVTNLISNAMKYSPENSTIHIRMREEDSQAILQVHNDGPVISQEQQRQLFEPFYRTPYAEYSFTSGWGLGLAICKEIVERHGGRIWVQSSQEEGTTFFVALCHL